MGCECVLFVVDRTLLCVSCPNVRNASTMVVSFVFGSCVAVTETCQTIEPLYLLESPLPLASTLVAGSIQS